MCRCNIFRKDNRRYKMYCVITLYMVRSWFAKMNWFYCHVFHVFLSDLCCNRQCIKYHENGSLSPFVFFFFVIPIDVPIPSTTLCWAIKQTVNDCFNNRYKSKSNSTDSVKLECLILGGVHENPLYMLIIVFRVYGYCIFM